MFPSGHKKLAKFIFTQFPSLKNKEELIKGSLDPDRKPSFWKKSPHHFGREKDIINFLYKARRNFLKGRVDKCCYFLGYALHFIGDMPIYSPALYPRYRKGRGAGLKTWHARRRAQKLHKIFEREISKLTFQPSIPFLILSTPLEIEESIKNFLYKDVYYSPSSTLERIYNVSFALTEICIRDPKFLNQEEKKLLKAIPKRKIKVLLFIIFEISLSIILLIFSPFLLWFALLFLLKLLFYFTEIKNPWKLEGWYKKKISFIGISKE